jgi:hypothetical protein
MKRSQILFTTFSQERRIPYTTVMNKIENETEGQTQSFGRIKQTLSFPQQKY